MPRQFPPVVTRGRRLSRVDDAAEINRCESRSPSSSRVPSFNNFNRRNSSTGTNNDNFNSFGGSRRGSVADMFGEQIVRRPSMHMARDVSPVKQIKIEKIEQEHTSQKQEFHTTKRIVKSEVKMDENNEDVFTEALTSLKNNNLSNIDKQVSISSTANATRGAILKTFKDLPSLNSRQNVKVSNKSIDSADKNFTETVNFCDIKAVENVTMRKEVHQEFKQETHIHQEFHEVHNKEIHTKKMINVQENHQENTTSIAENFQITGSFQNVVHGQTSEFEAMNKLQLGNNEVEPELTEVTKALSEYEEPMDFKSSFLANGTISPTKGMTNAAPIFKPEPKKERQILQQNQSEPRDVLKINKSINSTIIQSTSQNSIQSSLQQSSLGQISGKNEDLAIDFDQKVRARMSANENIKNAQVIGPDVENLLPSTKQLSPKLTLWHIDTPDNYTSTILIKPKSWKSIYDSKFSLINFLKLSKSALANDVNHKRDALLWSKDHARTVVKKRGLGAEKYESQITRQFPRKDVSQTVEKSQWFKLYKNTLELNLTNPRTLKLDDTRSFRQELCIPQPCSA